MARRSLGPVEAATKAELGRLPEDLGSSAQAATALELARGLDTANSLTSKSMAAKTHSEIMDRLRELAPPKEEKDGVDDLSAARAKRLARIATAAD